MVSSLILIGREQRKTCEFTGTGLTFFHCYLHDRQGASVVLLSIAWVFLDFSQTAVEVVYTKNGPSSYEMAVNLEELADYYAFTVITLN